MKRDNLMWLKPGTIFKIANRAKDDIFVLTNKYVIDEEAPYRKIRECVSLADGETKRLCETISVIVLESLRDIID